MECESALGEGRAGFRVSGSSLPGVIEGDALMYRWDDDGSLGDSGAYAYGMALADISSIRRECRV